MTIATLKRQNHSLSDSKQQLEILSNPELTGVQDFETKLKQTGLSPIVTITPEILQVNLGKMCNQTCRHCHVDAGPDRKEIMSKETMEEILMVLDNSPVSSIDITGGAPELNPNFKWFVTQAKKFEKHIMVRCNLTIIESNSSFNDLPEFYRDNKIEVIASLPYYSSSRTDAQRGTGVFEKSIRALKRLNEAGYGQPGSDLQLNLVYNPSGAFLPGNQDSLELEFKRKLEAEYQIQFNKLFTITNLPISRFLDYLITAGNLQDYMVKLVNSFNPSTTQNLMCKNTLSVGWDGALYDCDFNQMLDLKFSHVRDLNWSKLANRRVITNRHCYGCTAGAGSSCGGAIT